MIQARFMCIMFLKRVSLLVVIALIVSVSAYEDTNDETVDAQEDYNSSSEESDLKEEDQQNGAEVQVEYSNVNESAINSTLKNSTNLTNTTVRVTCVQNRTSTEQPVEIVNSTRLTSILQSEFNVTSRSAPGNCVAVLFYSPSCIFSCHAAPHYNALHRHFRDIKMVAVDATTHRSFNAQYGIFGIPMLILFHNGKPVARLNETNYNLKMFALFIKSWTNLKPTGKLVVQSSDFSGPISSVPVNDRDYYLLLSWIVIAMQLLYTFYRSSWGRWLADATLSAWREAEDQHHHID